MPAAISVYSYRLTFVSVLRGEVLACINVGFFLRNLFQVGPDVRCLQDRSTGAAHHCRALQAWVSLLNLRKRLSEIDASTNFRFLVSLRSRSVTAILEVRAVGTLAAVTESLTVVAAALVKRSSEA